MNNEITSEQLYAKLYHYKAVITNVVDGDTIDAEIDLGFRGKREERLRLLGIDTPERGQINYAEAKQFVKDHVLDREVVLNTYKDDDFGRYLTVVYYVVDDVVYRLHAELFRAGLFKIDSKWNEEAE